MTDQIPDPIHLPLPEGTVDLVVTGCRPLLVLDDDGALTVNLLVNTETTGVLRLMLDDHARHELLATMKWVMERTVDELNDIADRIADALPEDDER